MDTFIDCKPKEACDCGGIIVLNDKIHIHQVFDIPLARYEVTEYRIYRGCCKNCHQQHKGHLPAGVSTKDIPSTNNHAERQLRPLVISKKLSFGTQSNRGSRFIERVFTVITSCQQQGRDILSFIIQSLQHHMLGIQAPSLLAASTS